MYELALDTMDTSSKFVNNKNSMNLAFLNNTKSQLSPDRDFQESYITPLSGMTKACISPGYWLQCVQFLAEQIHYTD